MRVTVFNAESRSRGVNLIFSFLVSCACMFAAQIKGTVVDPSGAPVVGAQVSVVTRLGVEGQTRTGDNGAFEMSVAAPPDSRVVVTAPGFSTQSVAFGASVTVRLEIAPQVDSVRVAGSAIDAAASEQGNSVNIISRDDLRRRNEAYAADLLRFVPGLAFNQNGASGAVSSLFLRGGNSEFTLVSIDGVPVNKFGGAFDFAHIPSEALDRIDVIRGAQSSVYGLYANSGAIDFITRQPGSVPQLDVLAEGGTFRENRFGITGSATLAGFGLVVSASRSADDGPVRNSDYHNDDVLLNVTRGFAGQRVALHADFDSNESGEPGPWGSDPKHTFSGIDTISRAKNNFGDYGARYEADLTSRVRLEVLGAAFRENSGYSSPYGFSFDKNRHYQGEARTIVSFSPHDVTAFGFAAGRETVTNTFITNASFDAFPLHRADYAAYAENRFELAGRLFLNAGVRAEWIRTRAIPGDGFSRPAFPSNTVTRANPKVSAAYLLSKSTRIHSSFGTGIRPPDGFEIAFTDNPALKPERTRSVDAGLEQKVGGILSLDATYFYNRYYDLIVTLGGSLRTLSHYQSANLANSRAEGAEFSAALRPSRSLFFTGSYTLLETRILSLDGSTNLAPVPFQVGQQLTRRPEHSGAFVATYTHGRMSADLTGYFRGKALFEEPSYGASNGLFWNPGFANVGINVNYSLGHGVTAYGNLRNALDRHYEEVFGFPSPRLNFVAGMKWTISREAR